MLNKLTYIFKYDYEVRWGEWFFEVTTLKVVFRAFIYTVKTLISSESILCKMFSIDLCVPLEASHETQAP